MAETHTTDYAAMSFVKMPHLDCDMKSIPKHTAITQMSTAPRKAKAAMPLLQSPPPCSKATGCRCRTNSAQSSHMTQWPQKMEATVGGQSSDFCCADTKRRQTTAIAATQGDNFGVSWETNM